MTWVGSCNQCGLCCTGVLAGRPLRCEHLVVTGEVARCAIYEVRYEGMEVNLVDALGERFAKTVCQPDYPQGLRGAVPAQCGYRWE